MGGAASAGPQLHTVEVQQGFPFAGTRHDRGPATSVRGLWVKFLCKGPEVHLTSLFIAFCHPFSPLLDNWVLPQMATHDFGSHGGGGNHPFIHFDPK